MPKIIGKVTGQPEELVEARTVGEVRSHFELGYEYSASLNGISVSDNETLQNYQVVSFSAKTKSGN